MKNGLVAWFCLMGDKMAVKEGSEKIGTPLGFMAAPLE
jgi:hypothetical protein